MAGIIIGSFVSLWVSNSASAPAWHLLLLLLLVEQLLRRNLWQGARVLLSQWSILWLTQRYRKLLEAAKC